MIRESLVRFLQERVPTLSSVNVGNNPDLNLRALFPTPTTAPFAIVSFVNVEESLALLGDAKRWDDTMIQVGLYAQNFDDQRHFAQKIKREFDLMSARDENGNTIPGIRLMGIFDRLEKRSGTYFSDQPNWTGDIFPQIYKNGVLFGAWTAKLEGDVLPESATPTWTKTSVGGTVTAGNDLRGLDLKVFKITTDAGEFVEYKRVDSTLTNSAGTTVDLRHFRDAGALTEPFIITIRDGVREAQLQFAEGTGWNIVGTSVTKDVSLSEWHSVRFSLRANTARLTVDGVFIGSATILIATAAKEIVFRQDGSIDLSTNSLDYLRYLNGEITQSHNGPDYSVSDVNGSVSIPSALSSDDIRATYSCGFVDFVVASTVTVPPAEAEDLIHKYNTFFTLKSFLHLKSTAGKFF